MDDLISVAATIQGAQIQANYALWAAVVGGVISGLALIISIKLTANSTLKAHKADKLAEARRDIYLNLIRNWYSFILVYGSYTIIKNNEDIDSQKKEFKDRFMASYRQLTTSLHESSFISEPATKEKILDFTMQFSEDLFYLNDEIDRWYANPEERIKIQFELMDFMNQYGLKAMILQKDLRLEMGVNENEEINERILKKQKAFSERIKAKIKKRMGIE